MKCGLFYYFYFALCVLCLLQDVKHQSINQSIMFDTQMFIFSLEYEMWSVLLFLFCFMHFVFVTQMFIFSLEYEMWSALLFLFCFMRFVCVRHMFIFIKTCI